MNHLLIKGLLIAGLSISGIYVATSPQNAIAKTPRTPVKKPTPAASEPAKPTPAASEPAKPTPAKPEAKQTMINKTTIQDNGIRYELSACRRLEATVVCRLSLTNKGEQDIAASFKTAGSRFIDRDGEEYLAKEVQIGSLKSESETENTLISDVPMKATVTFDAPPANVATMAVLAINHTPGTTLKFRNVKIIKS
jgi:hypothetical protein